MVLQFPLPQDTEQKFRAVQRRCSNLSLLLDRYYGYENDENQKKSERIDFFKSIEAPFNQELVSANYKRWQAIVQSLPHAQTFTTSPEWRIVVGLGRSSVLETSMMLDRITGIPLIPGSALKGLAASYALLCVLGKTNRIDEVEKIYEQFISEEIDQLPENFEDFIKIFGHQGTVGKVIFLDAVPTKAPMIKPDVMNNHYPEYYSDPNGTQFPTPYQNPVPIYFLTLEGSQFAFAIAGQDNQPQTQSLVQQAQQWLQAGLSDLGIGAKTAAGYGYFNIPS